MLYDLFEINKQISELYEKDKTISDSKILELVMKQNKGGLNPSWVNNLIHEFRERIKITVDKINDFLQNLPNDEARAEFMNKIGVCNSCGSFKLDKNGYPEYCNCQNDE